MATYWQRDWQQQTAVVDDYFLSSTPPGNIEAIVWVAGQERAADAAGAALTWCE